MDPEPDVAGCSETRAELREILDAACRDARQVLAAHRATLDRITAELLRRETLDETGFRTLLHEPPRGEMPA